MKPYFAKWLPVKGEMKEGDDVITITGYLEKYNDWISLQGPTKVKLFLCSRDIQVGDEEAYHKELGPVYLGYLSERTGEWDVKKAVENEEDEEYTVEASDLFKVIGEISPEATWVKEGDEFDEEEWKVLNLQLEIFLGKDVIKIPIPNQFYPWVIVLKGPCGHFH